MRRFSTDSIRMFVTMMMMLALAVPAHAREDRDWLDQKRERIVKIIKKVMRTFGDELTDPRPKP